MKKKIAFTICSNNYLSLARALGRSLFQTGNDYHFIIGLVDKLNDGLKEYYKDFEVLPCDQIGIHDLDEISLKYTISEFNTALKPFYYQYLFNKYPEAEIITFLDPDMLVYRQLTELEEGHRTYDIIMTPHILEPQVLDGKYPDEISYLSTGTFNLGFLSLRKSANTFRMLDWWAERLRHFCYFDFQKGLFVDQKWMNLVPVFFDSVFVLRHYGYNVAYWNLQERKLTKENGVLTINRTYPLTIYHFSSVGIKQGKLFHKQQTRYVDEDLPLNKEIFMEYRSLVLAEGYEQTNPYKCYYIERRNEHITRQLKSTLKGRIKLFLQKNISPATRQSIKRKLKSLGGS
jgi:hypothetical protein